MNLNFFSLQNYKDSHQKRLINFLIALILTLIILIFLGHRTIEKNTFEGVQRFHDSISPSGDYFPTARQLKQYVLQKAKKDKINLIIGGSSVMYGVGQPQGVTIADQLQEKLGPNYVVINLASKGGSIMGPGLIFAMLLKEIHYRVIYIADKDITLHGNPMGNSPTLYFHWDAKFNNMLKPWKPREEQEKNDVSLKTLNLPLGQLLNQPLAFNEFWNTVGFHYFYTTFSILTPNHFWIPRSKVADREIDPQVKPFFYKPEHETRLIENMAKEPDPDSKLSLVKSWDQEVPSEIRPNLIVVLCENNPILHNLLNETLQEARLNKVKEGFFALAQLGQNPVIACSGLLGTDYTDRVHLAISGAEKMTSTLVSQIAIRAKALGYQ
jgi:hypothetical protein